MTKRGILLLMLSVFFVKAYTQKKFVPEWNIGVGGGATFSSVSFKPAIKTTFLPQFQLGVSARYISEKNLGIIAELNYSERGWRQNFQESPNYTDIHQLSYLDIPVLTHIYFGNNTRFFFNFGPNFGFLLNEKETMSDELKRYVEINEGSQTIPFPTSQYGKQVDKSFSYGLLACIGMEIRSKLGNFSIEGRYLFGLSDIYNSTQADNFQRSANKMMSIRLTYYTKFF